MICYSASFFSNKLPGKNSTALPPRPVGVVGYHVCLTITVPYGILRIRSPDRARHWSWLLFFFFSSYFLHRQRSRLHFFGHTHKHSLSKWTVDWDWRNEFASGWCDVREDAKFPCFSSLYYIVILINKKLDLPVTWSPFCLLTRFRPSMSEKAGNNVREGRII